MTPPKTPSGRPNSGAATGREGYSAPSVPRTGSGVPQERSHPRIRGFDVVPGQRAGMGESSTLTAPARPTLRHVRQLRAGFRLVVVDDGAFDHGALG